MYSAMRRRLSVSERGTESASAPADPLPSGREALDDLVVVGLGVARGESLDGPVTRIVPGLSLGVVVVGDDTVGVDVGGALLRARRRRALVHGAHGCLHLRVGGAVVPE